MKTVSLLLIFIFLLLLFSCRPLRNFNRTRKPLPPDYSLEKSWIALPWKHDMADTVPKGCSIVENQVAAKADVFFIHPTTYTRGGTWNASVAKRWINRKSDRTIQYQASVFNNCARVFAPRYRQAILKAFFNEEKGKQCIDLAYEDVKKAFEYYLEHYNQGRPIIIAGHSQGARHAMRLLKDFFDGKELQDRLIVAYTIGMHFKKDELKHIHLSQSETETGVYLAWNTFKWNSEGKFISKMYAESPCVNPLTMKVNEDYAPDTLNLGGVGFKRFTVDPHICDAQVKGGIVWVHRPKKAGYFRIFKSYHLWDYNLFYMNVRVNAQKRVEEFLRKNGR